MCFVGGNKRGIVKYYKNFNEYSWEVALGPSYAGKIWAITLRYAPNFVDEGDAYPGISENFLPKFR